MKNRLSWVVSPALAALLACSVDEGRGSRNPASGDWLEVQEVTSSFSASQVCTQGYWKNHPEAWPDVIEVDGEEWSMEYALQILATPPRGDAWFILAHQLIAAKLNELGGADVTAVAGTISDAEAWLVANTAGEPLEESEREYAIALAETLDIFNNSMPEPEPCDASEPSTPPEEPS
jgi:hypothetical protein